MVKILIAVDGSETSWRAVNEALRLLPLARAEVHLVCVAQPPTMAADTVDVVVHQFAAQLRAEARRTLHATRKALEAAGVAATPLLLDGHPATEILACAARLKPDLIVLGSHGRGTLGRLVLGSVSEAVTRRWPGATLVVRSPNARPATVARDVRSLMTPGPVSIQVHERADAAARLMRENDTGFLPVLDGRMLVGVLTDRDLATRVVARGLAPPAVEVEAIYTRDPVWVSPDMPVAEAVAQMERHRIRRVVVMDGATLAGVVSLGDLAEVDQIAADYVLAEVSRSPKTLAHASGPAG